MSMSTSAPHASHAWDGSRSSAGVDHWLRSPLLAALPEPCVVALLDRLRERRVPAGTVVIRQGDPARRYYVIKEGRCRVTRRPTSHGREVHLADLLPGQGFGEEALITDAARNATVTMVEPGVLLELGKEDFIRYLARPVLRQLSFEQALGLVEGEGAVLLDVRSPEEYETASLLGSLNIPLPLLRLKAARLDPQRPYVVCSDTGQSGAAAAFLLIQQGRRAYVLAGGLRHVPAHRLRRGGPGTARPAGPGQVVALPGRELAGVADEVLWKAALGLRRDPSLEALLEDGGEGSAGRAAAPSEPSAEEAPPLDAPPLLTDIPLSPGPLSPGPGAAPAVERTEEGPLFCPLPRPEGQEKTPRAAPAAQAVVQEGRRAVRRRRLRRRLALALLAGALAAASLALSPPLSPPQGDPLSPAAWSARLASQVRAWREALARLIQPPAPSTPSASGRIRR